MSATNSLPYIPLLTGHFAAHEVQVSWKSLAESRPPQLQREIDAAWQGLRPNPHFNGRIARLEGWEAEQGRLELQLRPTDYKTLLYSNGHVEEIVAQWGERALAKALGISAVVLSADGELILMQRSELVGEYPGCFDVFGGHIDAPARGGRPDPFASMEKELAEELALAAEDFVLRCIGLVLARKTRKPELIFRAHTRLTSDALLQAATAAQDRYEYTRLLTVPAEAGEIAAFLQLNTERVSPSACGALELFAATLLTF